MLFLFASTKVLFSQNINLQGVVKDSIGNPIEYVSVVLFKIDNTFVANTRTNEVGSFEFRLIDPESYILKFNSLSFKTDDVMIDASKSINKDEPLVITMYESITRLNEVVVKAEHEIKISGDTITFKAINYLKNEHAILEDLLKNLPGFRIDENGIIKINNQEISKVLIEGDDVFDQNYKIATKNIDAQDIDKIEIIFNFDEDSVLRSITKSEEIAINVIIKNDRKGAVYGNTKIGAGNDNNHEAELTTFKINSKIKTFLINKTNSSGINGQDYLNNSFFNRKQNSSKNKYSAFSKNLIRTDDVLASSDLNSSYVDDNQSYFNSINLLTKPSENTRLRIIGYFINDALKKSNQFRTSYYTPPVFEIFQSKEHESNNRELNAEINLKHASGRKMFIEYNGIINDVNQNTTINFFDGNSNFKEKQRIRDAYISQQLNISLRLNANKALAISSFFVQDNNPQFYSVSDLSSNNNNSLNQTYENPITHYGAHARIISKSDEWNFGFINKIENINSLVLRNNLPFVYEDFYFINDLDYSNLNIYLFKENEFYISKLLDLTIKTEVGLNEIRLNDGMDVGNNQVFKRLYIQPEIRFSKKFKKIGAYNFFYKFSTKQPEITDLYQGLILTSNRSFSKGVDRLFNLYKHSTSVNFSNSDYRKGFFFNASANYTWNLNSFGYSYFNSPEFDITIKEKANENKLYFASVKVDKNIFKIKAAFSLSYNGLWNERLIKINGIQEKALSTTKNIQLKYGSLFSGGFNFKSGVKLQATKYSRNGFEIKADQWNSFFDCSYDFNDNLVLSFQTNQIYPNQRNINRFYNFVDAKLKYIVIKNKLSFDLSGQNLTNIKSFDNNYDSVISSTNLSLNLNRAFFIFSGSYRF